MDNKKRCDWVENTFEKYLKYHDEEWGVPVYDDKTLFEFLILEGAQAGLSWSTILNKREGYEKAYSQWDVRTVADYDEDKIQELINNSEIVRNKLKIRGSVINAQKFIEIQNQYGSFSKYIWEYVNHKPIQNGWTSTNQIPASTTISDAISKDLKKRGFKFVGSTIMYAFMQAVGMVNDHIKDCFRYADLAK